MPAPKPEPAELLQRLLRGRDEPLLHVERVPPRAGCSQSWPDWVPETLRTAFGDRGVDQPWRHQVAVAELVREGTHVVVCTPTASGKSLAYQLPVLFRLLQDPRATALYLSATRALAADQLRSVARPDVDLRGSGGQPVAVIESATGRLLGIVDAAASHVQVHDGAVYLHQGVSYVVDRLDLVDASATVHAEEPDWTIHPRDVTSLDVLAVRSYVDAGPVGLFLGEVEVTNQVVAYQRRRLSTREVLDTHPLDLPPRQLCTVAVWWTTSQRALEAAGVAWADVPGSLHAAEHASIGLLPLVATCDRWDIGGLSTAVHADTGTPTVFVYDAHHGGAGFAERAYHSAREWLAATRAAIADCGCASGCPSCVHSPKCDNGYDPLDKAGAVATLDVVLRALSG